MNISQLRAQTRNLTGIQSTDLLSNAELDIYLNEAYYEICRSHDWPFLLNKTTINITPGTETYALPADVVGPNIASVAILSNDNNRRQLHIRSRISMDRTSGPLPISKPTEYYWEDSTIGFWPLPSQAETVTIRYFTLPDLLSDANPTPIIPSDYTNAIAYGAAVRILMKEADDTDRGKGYNDYFHELIDGLRSDLLVERDRATFRLGGRRKTYPSRNRYYGA